MQLPELDARHYRQRLADEVTVRMSRKFRHPGQTLTPAEVGKILRAIHASVVAAVDDLDAKEIWRRD